jgi:hypothetical protein
MAHEPLRTPLSCAALLLAVALAGCRAPVAAAPAPAPPAYGAWTTPPDAEMSRLERRAVPGPDEGEPAWRIAAELTFASRYLWRGQLLTDDPVLQPAVDVGYGDFNLNVWANLDLTSFNGDEGEFNEVDLTLDWSRSFDVGPFDAAVSAGAIAYLFPNTAFGDTLEVFASVGAEVFGHPTVSAFFDVGGIDGAYWSLDVGESFDLGALALEAEAGVGWGSRGYNAGYFGVAKSEANDLHLRLAAPWSKGAFTLTPFVAWQSLLGGALRAASAESDVFVAGVTLSASP